MLDIIAIEKNITKLYFSWYLTQKTLLLQSKNEIGLSANYFRTGIAQSKIVNTGTVID